MFLNKIFQKVAEIPHDKLLHIVAGMLITLIVAIFSPLAPYAFVFGFVAGCFKELYDRFFGGTVDGNDIVATTLGSVIAQLIIYCYLYL